jgi:hypothetical protein
MKQVALFESETDLIERIREKWAIAIGGDGAFCPCCGKWGKVYKQKLNEHLALCLRWIYVHGGTDGWVNVQNTAPRWMLKSKTYPLLSHWQLIESQGSRSGIWRATAKGRMFADGLESVSSAVYIYDNGIWGFADEEVSFRGCFGKHFDFDELMSERFDWAKLKEKNT